LRRSLDPGNEAIASPSQGFYEARIFRGVTQSIPKAFDGCIQAMIKVHKGVSRPQSGLQFLTRDDFARFLEKQAEDLEGLFLQAYFGPAAREFSALQIRFEHTEADD
jgi:hypothetical protein